MKISKKEAIKWPDLGIKEERKKERNEELVVHLGSQFRPLMLREKKETGKTYREQLSHAWVLTYGWKYKEVRDGFML